MVLSPCPIHRWFMKTRTIIALFSLRRLCLCASRQLDGENGWCQTMTEDGQALVMLKRHYWYLRPVQGCPNGQQELMGSRISINGWSPPLRCVINRQAIKLLKNRRRTGTRRSRAIESIAAQDNSSVQVFGTVKFTRGDMLGFVEICQRSYRRISRYRKSRWTVR